MFKEFMGLAVAESTQQPAETFNFKPCTSTLKGICLLLTVISLNEPEEAKLGPPEVLTTESRLCFKKDNMNFNYCSELTVRVLIPLQWKELVLKRVPEVLRCSQAFEEQGCVFLEPGEPCSVPAAPRPPQTLARHTTVIPGHITWAATCESHTRGAGCAQEPKERCSISPATSAPSSPEISWCWLAHTDEFDPNDTGLSFPRAPSLQGGG